MQSTENTAVNAVNSGDNAVQKLKPELVDIKALRREAPFKDLFKILPDTLESITSDMRVNGYDPAYPMLIWDGVILDGHTRFKAAEEVGIVGVWGVGYNLESKEAALQVAVASQLDRRRTLDDADVFQLVRLLDESMPAQSGSGEGESLDKTASMVGPYKSKVSAIRYILKSGEDEIRQKVASGELSLSNALKACREANGEIKKRNVSGASAYSKIVKLLDSVLTLSKTDDLQKEVESLKDEYERKLADLQATKRAEKEARKAAREKAKADKKSGKSKGSQGQGLTYEPVNKVGIKAA